MGNAAPSQKLGPSSRSKDRFVVFAFAAAELLLEADLQGRITFAEGAFRARFGRDAQEFLGEPVISLVTAADRPPASRQPRSQSVTATSGRSRTSAKLFHFTATAQRRKL